MSINPVNSLKLAQSPNFGQRSEQEKNSKSSDSGLSDSGHIEDSLGALAAYRKADVKMQNSAVVQDDALSETQMPVLVKEAFKEEIYSDRKIETRIQEFDDGSKVIIRSSKDLNDGLVWVERILDDDLVEIIYFKNGKKDFRIAYSKEGGGYTKEYFD